MSQQAPLDLTASSDEEDCSVIRPLGTKKPNLSANGHISSFKALNMVDLTSDDPDTPRPLIGTLKGPCLQSVQKAHEAPIPTTKVHENGTVILNGTPSHVESHVNDDFRKSAFDKSILPGNAPVLTAAPDQRLLSSASQQNPESALPTRADLGMAMEVDSRPSMPASFAAPITPTLAKSKLSTQTQARPTTSQHMNSAAPLQANARVTSTMHNKPSVTVVQEQEERLPNPRPSASSVQENVSPDATNHKVPELKLALKMSKQSEVYPISLEFFQRSLQKSLRNLRNDHQYYLKSCLPYARHHHFSCLAARKKSSPSRDESQPEQNLRRPNSYRQEISPFAELKSSELDYSLSNVNVQQTAKLCQLGSKITKQGPEITAVPVLKYTAGNITIPPYTNYISTKRNILIEDDKNRTFLPYYGDDVYVDRDYAELESRITRNRADYHRSNAIIEKARLYGPYAEAFLCEVGCSVSLVLRYLLDETKPPVPEALPHELAPLWRNRDIHLDEDYFENCDNLNFTKYRNRFRVRRPRKQWQALLQKLPLPANSKEYAAAGLACAVFANLMGFSLWHVVKRHSIVLDAVQQKFRSVQYPGGTLAPAGNTLSPIKDPDPLGTYADLGCLVCYAHECPGHGEFDDEDEKENIRVRINAKPTSPTTPKKKVSGTHSTSKGLEPAAVSAENAIGMDEDKTVSGSPWTSFKPYDFSFKDDELCSDSCFWLKRNRLQAPSTWSDDDTKTFNTLAPAYFNNRRGPCFLALSIEKPCNEIFSKVLHLAELTSPKSRHGGIAARPGVRRHFDYWLEHSVTWEHHERPPFKPCNHIGPCNASTDCHCYEQNVTCEKTCMCADSCSKRYRGCTCAARGRVCWQNEKCDCYRLNRECDPDLCISCGAHEVLDPVNRYRSDTTDGKCTNVFVQRGIPRRTLLGHSRLLASGGVSGWGLYMGEATKKGDYIGEYVGEVISKEESEQRGIIYNKRNLSYLFDLNSTQTLDSTLVGNKFRYINHQAPPYANCQAKTLFCNTVHRIGMFACRNIEVGEEILFDYGEGFAAKFDLIKLDDQAQPKIEKRRKPIGYARKENRLPTLSKNGKRIGRPPKNPTGEQGIKGNTIQLAVSPATNKNVSPAVPKRHLKRKRSPTVVTLDGAVENDDNFEEILASDDIPEEISSSDSFRESDEEEVKRRRKARASKQSAAHARGWRTKDSKRGARRGKLHWTQKRKLRGGRHESAPKRGWNLKARHDMTAQIDDGLGAVGDGTGSVLQEAFRYEAPQKRGWKTRHAGRDEGKEVDNREAFDHPAFMQNSFSTETSQKRGWQTRYARMGLTHMVDNREGAGEGSSAGAATHEEFAQGTSQKRGLKMVLHKGRPIGSGLKYRKRGGRDTLESGNPLSR